MSKMNKPYTVVNITVQRSRLRAWDATGPKTTVNAAWKKNAVSYRFYDGEENPRAGLIGLGSSRGDAFGLRVYLT
jgi:hypothetical protein